MKDTLKSWLGLSNLKSGGDVETASPSGEAVIVPSEQHALSLAPSLPATPSDGEMISVRQQDGALSDVSEMGEADLTPIPPTITTEEKWEETSAPRAKFSFEFNLPKIWGKGEDADPVFAWQDRAGFLAVFDGMGGSGSTIYHHNDQTYTGAFIASRVVANEMRGLFGGVYPFPTFPLDAAPLTKRLVVALQQELSSLERDTEPTRLKSKMIRRLPTTMAGLFVEDKGETALCQALWAGDSRCYALSPEQGLQQLTRDDLKAKGDALENLKNDSPLSNCLHADGECEIRSQVVSLSTPCLLLAATDGCFGFLLSPAHFEFLLLDSLMSSADSHSWQTEITNRLQTVAGDDCSMAVLALGWSSHQAIQAAFGSRHQLLEREFVAPLDDLTRGISQHVALLKEVETRKANAEQQRDQLRQELWLRYKPNHDAFLDPVANETGETGL